MNDPGPLAAPGALRRLAPFLIVSLLAFATLLTPPRPTTPTEVVIAFGLMAAIMVSAIALPWRRLPAWAQAVPMLGIFVVIALVRDATTATNGFALLAMVPVFWLALYGTRTQLIVCLVALALTLGLPLLLVGPPQYPLDNSPRGLVGVAFVTIVGLTVQNLRLERAALLKELHRLARVDELTGLPNRRAWEEGSAHAQAIARRTGQPLHVAILDLDSFKAFNDRYGHQAGDRLLKAAAAAWRTELRETDMLARYGGDEFALALPACGLPKAIEVLGRVSDATPQGQTCSIGIARWDGGEPISTVIDRADGALYRVKRSDYDRAKVAVAPAA